MGIGWQQILIVVLIIVVIFGARKLPQLGDGLAKGIKNFKKGIKDEDKEKETKKEIPEEDKKEEVKKED